MVVQPLTYQGFVHAERAATNVSVVGPSVVGDQFIKSPQIM